MPSFCNVLVKKIGDLLMGASYAEIINPFDGKVVRKLTRIGNMVEIDAIGVKVVVALDTAVRYEPWDMDRGSLLFSCQLSPNAKLCTEGDILRLCRDGKSSLDYNILVPGGAL